MERFREKFEQIVIECVDESVASKQMIHLPLYNFMKTVPIEYLPDILSNYYVDIFRPADRDLGQLLSRYESDTALYTLSDKIMFRRIRDEIRGEYSKFGNGSFKHKLMTIKNDINYLNLI